MRVDEVFKQAASQGTAPISFEMFPPKGELTLDTAREVAGNLCKLSPSFVSVTCSAGGSGNGATTAPIAHMITSEFDTPSVAHLTCVGRSHADIAAKIDEYRTAGVENILALRGDLPAGATEDDKPASDYAYARDLIPELVDAGFCVGAAAYPEGHIACEDLNASVEYLKQKQDAGASFFVTQLFFDNECFYRFRELADKAGITVPITAGIMPFMGKSQISRMVFMCGASLPSPVIKILAKYENDPESLQAAGVDYAARQLCDLKEHGADGLHLYTMNRPAIAATIMERLGYWKNRTSIQPLPKCRPTLRRRRFTVSMLRTIPVSTVPRCCGIWVTAASRLSPSCRSVLSLSLSVWSWTLSPAACDACLPSMPRASTSRASPASAWLAPMLNCGVVISIAISKTPALPHSWHAPSAWTPNAVCAPRELSSP